MIRYEDDGDLGRYEGMSDDMDESDNGDDTEDDESQDNGSEGDSGVEEDKEEGRDGKLTFQLGLPREITFRGAVLIIVRSTCTCIYQTMSPGIQNYDKFREN